MSIELEGDEWGGAGSEGMDHGQCDRWDVAKGGIQMWTLTRLQKSAACCTV